MNNLVLTVTPNPAVDVTYTVPGINLGASHRVPTPLHRAGGKGLNVSRVAHQLGHPTLAVATVGGLSGERFRTDLDASGMLHQLVPVAADTRSSIALVDTAADFTTSIFNESGQALSPEEWQALAAAVVDNLAGVQMPDGVRRPGVLVGSGSLPDQAPADFYPALVALAHGAGVPAIIDTSGAGILAAAKAGADLLKPNNHELMEAVGETNLAAAARKLMDLGARRVLVSVGEEGMLAFSAENPGRYIQAKLPAPLSGNPTGAGDAAVSAAAVALANGVEDLREILRRATSWSAAAVLMPGAGEISPRYTELAEQLIITDH
ncbi:1-phosphofructokinase family hexose kinase [Arthrobacter stackebrandtii]|uniref:1-phosphofructokinase family hexose kinase n=1 Tax=Arthrobacter stackebrandtii TaxID=272161 RepID=A0ABS4YRH7_9MICC|nr:1-phosphofructokinase family hexose kinase [Arthrobacter stackebrandtii]MBP2411398.1 1-phosphofructokinase family hexose kinase [Arthrobacter stackebrandtii]PYH00313.1 ribokinase [Arthrobacter stackebrandtii]